uniref:CCHC-type domain-containing protein n=1 Tax=Strigamia maritima TaxID=126957 RepID=T1IRX6_STRMM
MEQTPAAAVVKVLAVATKAPDGSVVSTQDETETAFQDRYKIWKKSNAEALNLILATIDDSQLQHVLTVKTAKQAWEKLELANQGLMQELTTEQSSYLLLSELEVIGSGVTEPVLCTYIFKGLTPTYQEVVGRFETLGLANLSLQVVKRALLGEEARKSAAGASIIEGANWIRGQSRNFRRNNSFRTGRGAGLRCYNCNRIGHRAANCRDPPNTSTEWSRGSFTPRYQSRGGNSRFRDRGRSRENTQSSRAVRDYTGLKNDELQENALHVKTTVFRTGNQGIGEDINSWYLDSGAISHMSSDIDKFVNIDYNANKQVTLADGRISISSGIGQARLIIRGQNGLKILRLDNVLYIPSLNGNLLSAGRIVDLGYTMDINHIGCSVYTSHGQLVFTAPKLDRLFRIPTVIGGGQPIIINQEPRETHKINKITSASADITTWH